MKEVTCSSTRPSCGAAASDCVGEIDACMHASIAGTVGFCQLAPRTSQFRLRPRLRSGVPMEAATPLRNPSVRVVGDRLAIDGLVVADETAVRLVREGDDPVRVVEDAIEIGARVPDREQAGANAELVRSAFGKTRREAETAFTGRARGGEERLG